MKLPIAIIFCNGERRFVTGINPFKCSMYHFNALDQTPENMKLVEEAIAKLPKAKRGVIDPPPTLDVPIRFPGGYTECVIDFWSMGDHPEMFDGCPEPFLTGDVVLIDDDCSLVHAVQAEHTGANKTVVQMLLRGKLVDVFQVTGEGGFCTGFMTVADYRRLLL